MINWERVDELRSEIGEEGFAEVVELFLDEVESTVMQLPSQPLPALESSLHFLKGSAWNLGFREFGALCQDGERKAAAGRGAEVDCGLISARYFTSRQTFLEGLAARNPSARVA